MLKKLIEGIVEIYLWYNQVYININIVKVNTIIEFDGDLKLHIEK